MTTVKFEDTRAKDSSIISDPDYSVWVEASAGTGKTKALTDRVIRLLLNGTLPEKILCITFTKAAANEMAQRISEILQDWSILPDSGIKNKIEDIEGKTATRSKVHYARTLFPSVIDRSDSIRIYTIHSFCQYLLKRFPMEAGVSPNFTVLDEQESIELINDAYRKLLVYSQYDQQIKTQVNYLAKNSSVNTINEVVKFVVRNRAKLKPIIARENAVKKIYEILGINQKNSEESIKEETYGQTDRQPLLELSAALKQGSEKDIERSEEIDKWLESGFNFYNYVEVFLTQENTPRKTVITAKAKEYMRGSDGIIEKEQERLSEAIEKIKSLKIAMLTESVLNLAETILDTYGESKNSESLLDYDDLINISQELVSRKDASPWILYKLDGGIDYLLVDEAQDTSPAQWNIIRAICDEFFSGHGASKTTRRIFIVGDEKQSIFSFQGADPKEFGKMHKYFSQKASQSKHNWQTASLDTSFRSTEAILRAVDTVFSDDKLRKAISADATNINHEAHRLEAPGRVEVWDIATHKSDNIKRREKWPTYTAPEVMRHPKDILAEKIVNKVYQWLNEKRIINTIGGSKFVSPGDIMILVRKRDELVNLLVKRFKKLNINVAGIDRLILSDYIAIMDLISLGNFILLPEDDLNLATLLKSPLFGFSEEQLFDIAYGRGSLSLWNALQDNKNEKYCQPIEKLKHLAKKAEECSPFEFYSYVIDVYGGKKAFIKRIGEESLDPLSEFLNLCLSFERRHTPSLQGFVKWFQSGQREIKRDLEQASDAIRIITVHASKGLQSPIVFLTDNTESPERNNSAKYLWDDSGLPLWVGTTKNLNKHCSNLFKTKRKLEYEEYIRLLYVGMTRAADELYICGHSNQEPHPKSWYSIIKNSLDTICQKEDGYEYIVSGSIKPIDVKIDSKDKYITPALPQYLKEKIAVENVSQDNDPSPELKLFADANSFDTDWGKAIHRLLEILPNTHTDNRETIAINILNAEFPKIKNWKELITQVTKIIDKKEFKKFFATGSRAEVEIIGKINNKVASRRVDRLIINEDNVTVIDYKSGNTPENKIPEEYVRQMNQYKTILSDIYPDKLLNGYLLWTSNLRLTKIF